VREDIDNEFAHIIVDLPTVLNCGDDGREIVVSEHHRRCFAGDIGTRSTHRYANVGSAQCWRVIEEVLTYLKALQHDLIVDG
jgi:hypothetical protein